MTEQWRPIPGFENYYEASDLGRVRSVDRIVVVDRLGSQVVRQLKGCMLQQSKNGTGYASVSLCRDRAQYARKVHQLVLEAFVGPRSPGTEGCHNDGDRLNNRLDNLRWDTRAANVADSIKHGTFWSINRTHCPQGHPYSPENTYSSPNRKHRECRICRHQKGQVRLDAQRTMPHSSKRTYCPQGHEYTPVNTVLIANRPGCKGRRCKTCHNERTRLQQQRRRAEKKMRKVAA